ncbi:protein-glutamate O-methyltransferase CheR [Geobacter sp. AOG1]|uniref:CheR family methyltransferase n=1 Tax=Geobacter sp. AOG1 TaxID=1566346 RepID=UPI001CC3E629|nr:protein-glutamate O-methyltransferase CheR [Geobacter sp. AOG1]GFE58557.1 chemotaxis protein methyltransferase [Geobacter sp. AOG1]
MTLPTKSAMNPEEFRLIQEFVNERFGLVLDENKAGSLAIKLAPRLDDLHLGTIADYYYHLKFSPDNRTEHLNFISLLTNNETYFFREDAQLKVFSDSILSFLKENRMRQKDRRIRIVSAGCSSGEEAYTLAMLLLESGQFVWEWDVQIVGIDIDPAVIAKAEAGLYGGRALSVTPPQLLERYFRKEGDCYRVKEVLQRITSFRQGNLLEFGDHFAEDSLDIIFCRNVIIYFNDSTVQKTVEGFARALRPDGYLFLGHSESLARITKIYEPLRFPGAVIYKMRDR